MKPEISDLPPPRSPRPALSLAPPPVPETSTSSDFKVVRADEAPSLTPLVIGSAGGEDDGVAGSGPNVNRVGECGCGSGSKSVLAAFLKVLFVVVVLITSVMKLTVGITVSAFALLFVEYTGKRFEPLTKTVSNCVWFQKLRLKTKKDCGGSDSELAVVVGENIVVSELAGGAGCSSNSSTFDEIEVVETKSEVGAYCEETCFVDWVNRDKKLGCPEALEEGSNGKVVDSCEISQYESKGSRSFRFKSKMVKKFVPKKLRTSMKERKEKKSKESEAEFPISGREDIVTSFEIVEEHGDVGRDEKENGNGSPLLPKIKLDCITGDEVDHGIKCFEESSLERVEEVAVIISEDNRIDRVGNSGCIILFVIALAGLVVGRLPALILTMTWFFMLKIVTTQGKSQNVPRSSVRYQNFDRTVEGLR